MSKVGWTMLRKILSVALMSVFVFAGSAANAVDEYPDPTVTISIDVDVCSGEPVRFAGEASVSGEWTVTLDGVTRTGTGSTFTTTFPVTGVNGASAPAASGTAQATEAFLASKKAIMEQWGIKTSYLTCFAGPEFVIEPSFYWHDQLGEFRLSLIEPEFAEKWKDIPANEARRAVALRLRDELRDLFDSLGGMHLQIGKYYPYTDIMNEETLPRVVKGLKELLDPQSLVNPGTLGLG